MPDNQRWDADISRVNRDNGYLSSENRGAGITNTSFWNTTVLVTAHGFEAADIIFDNSFNQWFVGYCGRHRRWPESG